MRFSLRKPLAALLTAVFALTAISTASAAENEASSQDSYRIVALGDSISVGYEPGMTADSIPYGYVDRLFEQSLFQDRTELANYAIMGLTTPGLINLLQGAADGKRLTSADLQDFSSFPDGVPQQADSVAAKAPQLATDLAKANLVVMTIGANDFGPIINAVKDQPTDAARQIIQDSFDLTMNKYTEDLEKMITRLHTLAPAAQIVIADQYLPLMITHALYPDLLEAVHKMSAGLDKFAEAQSSKGLPVKIAHVSSKFEGNQSAYTHFNLLDDFDTHPSQAGYEAMAQIFADVIWKQYLKPQPREAKVPLSIVINGKEPPSKPTTVKNTTFLALRDVANAVGADLKWTQKTKTAVFSKDGREVIITIGAKTVIVNGVKQPLAAPAYFQQVGKELKTYVPLAVISAGLDYQVVFRKSLMTAFINS
ncbi:stalk domain-containing protein [Cohnella luojiensis]|uniref:Copper amine oxidase n=1 Tax=Cohnella luojiensis TaxID=652876 RepID=A0A4Y8LQ00_9BACL|nr:stalk domain-containing protein [Cohnella luojiensis]TFE22616.1 copper amine oxidase [Cohnella luojiensis]